MIKVDRPTPHMIPFWLAVWLGIVLAGGVLGLWINTPLGVLVGMVVVSVLSVPVLVLARTLTWFFWLTRFRILAAASAGGATGALTSFVILGYLSPSASLRVALASHTPFVIVWEALGAALAGVFHLFWMRAGSGEAEHEQQAAWQFSMRGMFLRISIVAVILAAFATHQAWQRSTEDTARAKYCQRCLERIAMGLKQYDGAFGRLPPLALVDDGGQPILSWRVHVLEEAIGGPDHIDLSEPWNGSNNSKSLQWIPFGFSCPGVDITANGITHYVALTGPGTHWTEVGCIDWAAPEDAVLVVAWPPSDIQWTEPRDISPERFLRWFESENPPPLRPCPKGLHYINARGEVRVLPWKVEPAKLRQMLTPYPESHQRP